MPCPDATQGLLARGEATCLAEGVHDTEAGSQHWRFLLTADLKPPSH